MVWDVASDATPAAIAKEFVIQLPIGDDNGTTGGAVANRNFAQSEIIALDDTHLLVLSRDGNGKGVTTATGPVFKSVLLIDLANATDIAGSTFDAAGGDITPAGTTLAPTITPIEWTEAVNLLNTAQLGKFDLNLNGGATANENSLSEKWEGLSLLPTGVANEYFLFVANDNDFISGATKMVGLDGSTLETFDAVTDIGIPVENDTMFLAYRVSITGTAAIPEPASSAALAGLALLGLAAVRRRNVR
jgi:MYXO-CTERM domain-containing protein